MAEIAGELGVSRALAKIHLRKLEQAGIVESRAVLEHGRAQARRYYRLVWRTTICISPDYIRELAGGGEEHGGAR